jgi:hypothetical protein
MLAVRLTLFPPYEPEIDKPWLNGVIMLSLAVGMTCYFPSTATLQADIDRQYPTAALSFMEHQHLQGRIFNADWWGGYMEWGFRDLKPFTDGRVDIFVYNGTFDDHVSAGQIQEPLEILDKYHIDYVLLESQRPLAYLLEHSPTWHVIYSDKVAVVLQRVGGG